MDSTHAAVPEGPLLRRLFEAIPTAMELAVGQQRLELVRTASSAASALTPTAGRQAIYGPSTSVRSSS